MRRAVAAALLFGICVGCVGSSKPPTIPAAGRVIFKKSTPAVGALVVFHPVEDAFERRVGGKPYAKVREDGTFTLSTYGADDGAPEAEYGVTIEWHQAPKDGKLSLTGEGSPAGRSMLNPKYSRPKTPPFRVTIKKGEANEFVFDVD